MDTALVSAGSALLGTLIGGLSPLVVDLGRAKREDRRERTRLAVELALADHKHLVEKARAKARKSGQRVGVSPISASVVHHTEMLEILAAAKTMEPEDFVRLRNRQQQIYDALVDPPKDNK